MGFCFSGLDTQPELSISFHCGFTSVADPHTRLCTPAPLSHHAYAVSPRSVWRHTPSPAQAATLTMICSTTSVRASRLDATTV